MVWIDIRPYPVCSANIAGIAGMHVRHLQDSDPLECRVVALDPDPLQGRLFNIVGKNFSASVLSGDCHKLFIAKFLYVISILEKYRISEFIRQ
jgi:hypothetical protein